MKVASGALSQSESKAALTNQKSSVLLGFWGEVGKSEIQKPSAAVRARMAPKPQVVKERPSNVDLYSARRRDGCVSF